MRILVIEDEFNLADIISSKLKKENYIVDIQNNGEDGLYSALSNVYDLILLDVMLPKINGFEILKKVKQNNISSKIIMLTAKSSIDDKLEGFQGGVEVCGQWEYRCFFRGCPLVCILSARETECSGRNCPLLVGRDVRRGVDQSFHVDAES